MRQLGRWLAIGTVLVAAGNAAQAADALDRIDVGKDVPLFSLKVLNPEDAGEAFIALDKYIGPISQDPKKEPKKAVLLSFFATYCDPCKREMPFLAALYDQYGDKGLQILLTTIDKEPDKVQVAADVAKENGVRFPVLSDRFNIVAKRYRVSKLPCVYVINGDGKVAMVNVGYNADLSKNLLDEVRKLIGVSASEPVPEVLAKHMAEAGTGDPESVSAGIDHGDAETQEASEEEEAVGDAGEEDPKAKGKKTRGKRKARRRKRR